MADELEFDEGTAQALEVLYGMRDFVRRRELVYEALAPRPGEAVLDVGCGPGFYVAELRERVGEAGTVAGVDPSPAMLDMTRRRVGGDDGVTLAEAPATALPFEAETFDAVVSAQVLEYVDDVDAALEEMRRVLRPGGRAVIWDVDWATLSMHAEDPERLGRVLAAWDRHLVHPSLPRTLVARLRRAGFEDVSLTGHAFTTHEFTPDAYGATLVATISRYLAGLDDFPDDVAQAWVAEQAALGEAGDFYSTCVQCCAIAFKATSG